MSSITYRDAVGKALQDCMRAESRLILIGQNLAAHSLKTLAEEFGRDPYSRYEHQRERDGRYGCRRGDERLKVVVMIAYADIASVCHIAIVQSAAKLHYLTNGRLQCPVILRLPIARFRGHGPMGNEVAVVVLQRP